MNNKKRLAACLVTALVVGLLLGCSAQPVNHSAHHSVHSPEAGVTVEAVADIPLYVGRTLEAWQVFIADHDHQRVLKGGFASLPGDQIVLKTSHKGWQKNALTFRWYDNWRADLTIENGKPLDLRDYLAQGALALDLQVIELAKGGLTFAISCGDDCERQVNFTDQGLAAMGQGWQNIRIPLSCFVQEGDDFSAVAMPFKMATGGEGELAIANIRLLAQAVGNVSCADYKTIAITPDKLREYWARDWWEPRHQEKLQLLKQGPVDLLMIGDSITEGWAKEGKETWAQYYASRNAINLGFGGDRTENVLWRLQHGELAGINPKVAVLMIGTNNTGHRLQAPKYTAEGIQVVLQELRKRLPDTKILLLGIFPRGEAKSDPMRKINDEINYLIAPLADNQHIFFLNINHIFLTEDGTLTRAVMPDLLHLNAPSYAAWAVAMEPQLSKLLGE